MKKLLFLFLTLFIFSGIYGQTSTITGEQQVCPNTAYTYTFKLAKLPVNDNLTVSVTAIGGKVTSNNQETANFNMTNGVQTVSFSVKWDDKGFKTGQKLMVSTSEGLADQDIYVASFVGTQASDYGYYGFRCAGLDATNKVIKIPYGSSGTLDLNVNTTETFYYKMTKAEFKTSTYVWKIGSAESEGVSWKTLQYGASDLDGTTISVYPVIKACNRTSNGSAATFKIERYVDAQLKLTSNKIACKNENITYALVGVPAGASIQWIGGTGMTISSGQGTTTAVFKSQGSGYANVTANVSYAGKSYTFKNSEVWVGLPVEQNIPILNLKTGQATELIVNFEGLDATTTYKWTRVSGDVYLSSNIGRSIWITPWDNNYIVLRVDVTNKCGTGSGLYQFKAGSGGLGGGGLSSLSLKSLEVDAGFTPQSVKVYNLSGVLVYSTSNADGFDLSTTTLSEGIYILEKSDGKTKVSEKVILKR